MTDDTQADNQIPGYPKQQHHTHTHTHEQPTLAAVAAPGLLSFQLKKSNELLPPPEFSLRPREERGRTLPSDVKKPDMTPTLNNRVKMSRVMNNLLGSSH